MQIDNIEFNRRIEASNDLLKIQRQNGNWNYDGYMHGLLNGMLLTHSIFTGCNYMPENKPTKWARPNWRVKLLAKIYRLFGKSYFKVKQQGGAEC